MAMKPHRLGWCRRPVGRDDAGGNIDDTGGLIPVISDFTPLPRGPQEATENHMNCFTQWGDFKAVDLLGGFINGNEVRTFQCRGCDSG